MVETTSKENSGVYFDHDNNSFAEQSGWVGKDDGLLVFDKTTMVRLMTALSYLAITRFYPMAIKQPMALKP
ncbi:Alkaline phosphatase (EC [uncultured Gammaproteobacteria bacterium]|nr:Alkaline phosphatase (EC [uncultured Gammaproteobacteria bacterium]